MNIRAQTIGVIVGLTTLAAVGSGYGSYQLARREEYRTVDSFLEDRTDRVERLLIAADDPAFRPPPERPPGAGDRPVGRPPRPPASSPVPNETPIPTDGSTAVPAPGGSIPAPVRALVGDIAGGAVVVRVIDRPDGDLNPQRTDLIDLINAESAGLDLPLVGTARTGSVMRAIEIDGVQHRLCIEVLEDGSVIYVARSLAEAQTTLRSLRDQLVVVIVPVIFLSGLLGWLAARRLTRPLEELAESAEHVARTGELDVDFQTDAPGEVGRVAKSFRSMLDSLSGSRQQQRRLVADAGHELRTPLTALRVNVELLASGKLTDDDTRVAVAAITAETRELSSLTGELVELATVAADAEQRTTVDLREIAERAADNGRRRHDVEISVEGRSAMVQGQAGRLERAISNLVDNAVKFAPPDTPIMIRVDSTSVAVVDRGPGIDEADLERLFERFYRSAAARSLPGSGLGLAIVDKVARDHGGRPFARNHANGATVGFTLQRNPVRRLEAQQAPAARPVTEQPAGARAGATPSPRPG